MVKLNFEKKGGFLIAQEGTKVWRIEPLAWAYLEVIELTGESGTFERVGEFEEIEQAIEAAEKCE